MDDHTNASPSAVPARRDLRGLLRLLLAAEMLGLDAELLLMEHWEDWWQRIPLILLGAGLIALAGHAICQNLPSRRVFQLVMLLFVLSGGLGMWFHYDGRAEFRREVDPSLSGWELFRSAMTGATTPPVLAPGMMIQMGCLGLILILRRPTVSTRNTTPSSPDRSDCNISPTNSFTEQTNATM